MRIFHYFFIILFSIHSLQSSPWFHDIQVTIGVIPFFYEAKYALEVDEQLLQNPLASEYDVGFIEAQFELMNLEIPKDFQVIITDHYCAGRNVIGISSTLVVGYSDLEIIALSLDRADLTDEQRHELELLLFQHVGSIHHEITHIMEKHIRNGAIGRIAISFTALTLLKLVEFKNSSLHNFLTSGSIIQKALYAFATGAGLLLLNRGLWYAYARHHEAAADEGILTNANLLLAKINHFCEIHESLQNDVKQRFGNTGLALFEKFPTLYLLYDPEHPILPQRIKRLQERVQACLITSSADSYC